MEPGTALAAVAAAYRRRPADLLPFYLLGAAVPAMARVVSVGGAAAIAVYLAVTGRLAAARAELAARDVSPPPPDADPDAVAVWVDELLPALEVLVTPTVVGSLAVTVLATLLVWVVLYAAVAAGQLAACSARLRDERGLLAGIEGARSHWVTFLGLFVLEATLWLVLAAAAALAVAVAAAGPPVAGLAAIVVLPLWISALGAVRAVFAFAPVVVIVDDARVAASLRRTVGFVRARPVVAAIYYVVAVATLVGFGALVAVLSVVGVGTVAALVGVFVVVPFLDLYKTALYAGYRGAVSAPEPPDVARRSQVVRGLGRGWTDTVAFVRSAPGLHAIAGALVVAGGATGWVLAGPLEGVVETSIAERIEGFVGPVIALEFFGNNWAVAFTMAYGGVALGVPSAVSLWTNGVVLAITARLEVDPATLLAFVLPHGVVELPAVVVAGALGLHLGRTTWRTRVGGADRGALADELERAFWVVVGVGTVLAVAALVESFVSPIVAQSV